MTIKDIAKKYDVSIGMVNKWKDQDSPLEKKRTRRTKFNQSIKRRIYTLAANKFTGAEQGSSRKIMFKIRGDFKVEISHGTVNNYLRKIF